MAIVRKILTVIAIAAVIYFAPVVAAAIGATGFLATAIGAVVILAGTAAIMGINKLLGGGGTAKQQIDTDAGKVTIRVNEGPRWISAGVARQGGSVVFADFDATGNLWCVIVHSDSLLTGTPTYYLDDVAVTIDGAGNVLTSDFCLNNSKEPYKGVGTRIPYWQIWTTTYISSNVTPPPVAALAAALGSKWTSDHKLVGTTFSVMKGNAIALEHRSKVYKWRGPLGIGEPALSIRGNWSRAFDPRDGTQIQNNFTTHKFTKNPVLIWAWYRTHPYGRRKPRDSINWTKVIEGSNICDQDVTGIDGTVKRYECGISIPEGKERALGEQEILMTCDGQLAFDDQGRSYVNVGYYATPTVALSRNRDIVAMETVEATNGESLTQGVIVRYTEPSANDNPQPCAAWLNPNYYVVGEAATFLTVDILGCRNHNQAMRLAKSIGMRSQPTIKIAPTTGLRGLKLRSERIASLNYDNTIAGDFEIVTPVEVDESGLFCSFGAVPIDADRFTLLSGEEKPRPVIDSSSTTVDPYPPSNVVSYYRNNRFEFTFDGEPREDITYEFQYAATVDVGEPFWSNASTDMTQNFAYTGPVSENQSYLVRWRARTGSGIVIPWSTEVEITIADDGKLTVDEKIRILIPLDKRLQDTYATLTAAADARSISHATLDAARTAWIAFRDAITPDWDDITTDSPVDRVNYRVAITNYEDALEALRQILGQGANSFQLISVANMALLSPTSVQKVSGGTGWNAKARTIDGWNAGISISANDLPTTTGIGLTTDPSASSSYIDVDYWIYKYTDGNVYVFRNGVQVFVTAHTAGRYQVLSDNVTVRYLQGNNQIYSHAVNTPGETLFGVANINFSGDTITGIAVSPAGSAGANGTNGLNNAQVLLYKRASSSPAVPAVTLTYTFATGVLAGGSLSGWSQTVPAVDGNPLYVTLASASGTGATDTIATGEWASPVIQTLDGAPGSPGSNGTNGLNIATVYLFQRTTTSTPPAVPSATLTYTFATSALSGGSLAGWSQTLPTSGGEFRWIITASALSTGATDNIATGEWASPAILAQDGATGATGSTGATGADGKSLDPIAPFTVRCTAGETPKAGELALITGTLALRVGGTIQTSGVTYSIVSQSGFTGFSLSGSTYGPPTGMTARNATATLRATYLSVNYDTVLRASKALDGNAPNAGSAAITSVPSSATFTQVAAFNLSIPDGSSFNADANVTYGPTSSGNYTAQIKLTYQNITDGGAETDFPTTGTHPATGGAANTSDPDSVATTADYILNSTGATKTFTIRAYVRRSAGAGVVPGGNVSGILHAGI